MASQRNISNDLVQEEIDCNKRNESANDDEKTDKTYIAYPKRWFILFLFVVYSASNAFNWLDLVIISNVLEKYYNVSTMAITWTSMIYMAVYIPLIFPATWLLQRKGLRSCIIIGSLGNCFGSWLKFIAWQRADWCFPVLFVGQTVCAIAQIFVLGIPAELAGIWFPSHQVSTACAIGVFGNQVGNALGFVIPPIAVRDQKDPAKYYMIGTDLFYLLLGVAIITTLLVLTITFTFQDKPSTPPSRAQEIGISEKDENYLSSINRLLKNRDFILLLIGYGLNVGIFYAISSLLNTIILSHFKDSQEDAGWIGLTIVITGLAGSIICGLVLDKTHQFKRTTAIIYIFSFLGMVLFTCTISLGHIEIVYVTAGILGFFMTGYLPVGFDFGVEITYPESEGTSSGLLNASAQVFGIVWTITSERIISKTNDDRISNGILSAVLLIGALLTLLIKPSYRRQQASRREEESMIK